MRSTMIAATVAVVSVLGLSAILQGCGDDPAPKQEVRPVRTIVVDPKPIEDDRQVVGEIKPRQESDIGFRVGGKLISRSIDIGASVKAGETLARLDDQDFQNRLRSAQADVKSAEAVLVEASAAEDRQRQLLGKGVTTKANYDSALKSKRAAESSLESAKAALAIAKDQISYAELKADFDGIVTAIGAEPGQVVASGQMVLKLARPDQIDAVFNVAESAFRDRTPGDRPDVIVSLLSSPDVSVVGKVREVSPVADPTTRTYQVKVALDQPPVAMRFGAGVLGRLKATTAPVAVLPGSALFDKDGKPAVWIYDAATTSVVLRLVSVSRYEADRVVISEGLSKGDIVVTAGVNRLREKQVVRLQGDPS